MSFSVSLCPSNQSCLQDLEQLTSLLSADYNNVQGAYLTSNENGQTDTLTITTQIVVEQVLNRVIQHVAREAVPLPKGKVHLCFSCTQGYNYLHFDPAVVIMADISNIVHKVQLEIRDIILSSRTGDECYSKIVEFVETADSKNWANEKCEVLKNLKIEKAFSGSWLRNIDRVKRFYAEGRIMHVVLDVTDVPRMRNLKEWMEKRNLSLGLLYLANIAGWFRDSDDVVSLEKMKTSVRLLQDSETMIIDADLFFPWTESQEGSSFLYQAVFCGGEPYEPDAVRSVDYNRPELLKKWGYRSLRPCEAS